MATRLATLPTMGLSSLHKISATAPHMLAVLVLCSSGLCLATNNSIVDKTSNTSEDNVIHECQRVANKLGSVNLKDCLSAGLKTSAGLSVNKSPLLIREYPPLHQRKPQGKVLLLGGLHGDEYASASIIFKYPEQTPLWAISF